VTASIAQILPVALMPFLGVYVYRHGNRTLLSKLLIYTNWISFYLFDYFSFFSLVIGSGVYMLLSMLILEYTMITPVIGMLLFSVSLSLGPVGLVSSIPVILPLSLVGTGMGLVKSATNIGASLYDISTGIIQDSDPNKGYGGVILFFIGISILAVIAGITLHILDSSIYHSILDRPSGERNYEPKLANDHLEPIKANWFYGAICAFLCCLSWFLFFRFLLF
jgi:hypothetical protein